MFSKNMLKDFFSFSRKDRIFILFSVGVISATLFLPSLLAPTPLPTAIEADSSIVLAIDTLRHQQATNRTRRRDFTAPAYPLEPSLNTNYTEGELFLFDPNTASYEIWQRLGLNDRTTRTILNYLRKGGRFYKPTDLQKIWGMPVGFYHRVKDHIQMASATRQFTSYSPSRSNYTREEKNPVFLEINSADTTAFIALPGIGPKLAARIILFREKLGGFYSVHQVAETYGLPDSTFVFIKEKLRVNQEAIRKININTATKEQLKVHPYIRWQIANAIVEYRNQHGNFQSLEELKHIVLIDDALFAKIVAYLTLQEQ